MKNTGGLLIEELKYEFDVKNTIGDIEEIAHFIFHNPTNRGMQYLDTQFTSFIHRPTNPLSVTYATINSESEARRVSKITEHERTWNKGSDRRKVWFYSWHCEFRPPLAPKAKLIYPRQSRGLIYC